MKRARGFTLIEAVVTIIVLSILAAVGAPILSGTLLTFSETTTDLHTLSQLRYATERLAREVREVRHEGGTYSVSSMAASSLAFTKRDGISVTLSGTAPNLTIAYSTPSGTYKLTDQLQSLTLNYYQVNGVTAATNSTNLAFVQIDMTLQNPQSQGLFRQRTRVALRNRP